MTLQFVVAAMALGSVTVSGEGSCLSMRTVQQLAENNDPRRLSAEADGILARSELSAARSARYPQVSVFSRAGVGDGLLQSNLNDNELGVQLRQEIFSFGQTTNAIRAARERTRSGELELEIVATELRREATKAYLAFATAHDLYSVREQAEELYRLEVEGIPQRLSKNAMTEPDAARVLASVALAAASKEDAMALAAQAQSNLESLIGIAFECDQARLPEDVIARAEDMVRLLTADAASELIHSDPRLRQARRNIAAAEHEKREVARRHLPRLEMTAFQASTYNDNLDEWIDRDRIGLNISQDLFKGGMLRAERRKAAANLQRTQAEADRIERRLTEAVSAGLRQLTAYERAVSAFDAASKSQKTRLEGKQAQYDANAISIGELINAAEDYFETEENRIFARQTYLSVLFDLEIDLNLNFENKPISR